MKIAKSLLNEIFIIAQKDIVHLLDKNYLNDYFGYKVYSVDESAIRSSKSEYEEFTNFATRLDFPNLIPEGEIWVSEEDDKSEIDFYVMNAAKQLQLVEQGENPIEAYKKALQFEKNAREKVNNVKFNPHLSNGSNRNEIYIEKYETIKTKDQSIIVWIINGILVRQLFKTDFVEGGHGYIYQWIPNDEIWIEQDLKNDEIDFIIYHEFIELILMKDKKIDYQKAHEVAAKKEFEMRQRISNMKKQMKYEIDWSKI